MSPQDDPSGLLPVPRPGGDDAQNHRNRDGNEQPAADPAAANYSTPPASDPHAPRQGETPPDPYATNYGPTPSGTDGPQPGAWLARLGDYELLEEIGRGGMAIVYKARQQTPERLVALKVIKSAELVGADEVRRFRLEANEVARLDHPHIVPVYEVGEHGGQQFFTMKLIEGGSLSRHQARYQADLRAAAQLVATAARAVHHAHQRQLLHRDLKPGNILLDGAGQPHVADFGLAKRLGGEGEASQSVAAGTPEYMAPEQARGDRRLTTAVDVYGLGGVLYALLTGRPPFRGQSLWETLRQVQSQEPTLPSAHRAGCPRDLETICLKCLAKEPGRRYGSAEALAEDLERWLRGEPVQARPVGRWERVRMWRRRNPVVAALGAAFAAVLVLGTVLSTTFALLSDANYHDARQREKDANDALVKVTERDKALEETLARSLLRSLGQRADTVFDPEIAALWEVAGSSRRVRFLFADHALEGAVTARQLRNRADLALHAAVGLDAQCRQDIEQTLLARLNDPESDFKTRTDIVLIGLALGEWSPEFARVATQRAIEATGKWDVPAVPASHRADGMPQHALTIEGRVKDYEPEEFTALAKAVAVLAPRLTPGEAAAAARVALEEMAKADNSFALYYLAKAMAALAPRLEPGEAATVARLVVATMDDGDGNRLPPRAKAIAALAPRLEPAEAAVVAGSVVQAMDRNLPMSAPSRTWRVVGESFVQVMDRADGPAGLIWLAEAAAALAPRLGPSESSRTTAAANRRVLAALRKANDALAREQARLLAPGTPAPAAPPGGDSARPNRFEGRFLEHAVATLAPHLGHEEADAATRLLVERMGMSSDVETPRLQRQTIKVLALRLQPAEAAANLRLALQAMAKTKDREALNSLGWAVVLLAPRLNGGAAAAARLALDAMGKEPGDVTATSERAKVVATLAQQVKGREAAKVLEQVEEVHSKVTDERVKGPLDGAYWALVAGLEKPELANRIELLLDMMGKATGFDELGFLAELISQLALQLEPAEAARQARAAARLVLQGMGRPTKLDDFIHLASAMEMLSPALEPAEAAAATRQVLQSVGKLTESDRDLWSQDRQMYDAAGHPLGKYTESRGPWSLTRATRALAPRLESSEAAEIARLVLEKMSKANDRRVLYALAEMVAALAKRLEPADAVRQVMAAWRFVQQAPGNRGGFVPDQLKGMLAPWLEPSEALTAIRRVLKEAGDMPNPMLLSSMVVCVADLAGRLEPEEAARQTAVAARLVLKAMAETSHKSYRSDLARGLIALAQRLGPEEAVAVTREVLELMARTTDPWQPDTFLPSELEESSLPTVLAVLLADEKPDERSSRAQLIVATVGGTGLPPSPLTGLATLVGPVRPLPGRFTEQQLVDLLKLPTCRSEARELIVQRLGHQCGRPFANMWDFVDWAQKNRPDLDLTSPPVRLPKP